MADVDPLAVLRERHDPELPLPVEVHQERRQVLQADDLRAAEVEHLSVGLLVGRCSQKRIHRVVHVVEVAQLRPVPEHLDLLSFDDLPNPPPQKGLPRIPDPHARPDGVRQPEGAGPDPVDVVVDDVIPLPGHLVDAVHVRGVQQMPFVHRQIVRDAVDLPGARKDDLDVPVVLSAGLQDGELGAAVDLQVGVGLPHRVQVAGLSRQVEQVVLASDQIIHAILVPHVGDVHPHPVLDARDVEQVAAVFGDQGVHEHHVGPQVHQPAGQGGSDEPQPPRDQDLFSLECRSVGFHDSRTPPPVAHPMLRIIYVLAPTDAREKCST